MRHKIIVLTVKTLLKSVYIYGHYGKIKTGVSLFWTTWYVLVLALEVMDREAHPLGLTINWAKTKIQNLGDQDGANQLQYATIGGNQVEVVESFTYLGSLIHVSGSSEPEIKRRINIVHEAMFTLDQNIWRFSITLQETKLRLYNTCILPIFLYGAETWSVTVMLSKKIDALDNWCLRRILNVDYSEFVTNDEIRSRTGQLLLSECTAPTPHKTITVLYRLAFWVLLVIGDGGLVVPDNPG